MRVVQLRFWTTAAGAGEQYSKHLWHEAWGIMPTFVRSGCAWVLLCYHTGPSSSGVICTDVLEHVPEDEFWTMSLPI